MEIAINDKVIKQGGRAYVIAEIAQAHAGSVEIAMKLIDVAAFEGADAVKFQVHIAAAESTLDEKRGDEPRFSYWQRMEFSAKEWVQLRDHSNSLGLAFIASPFSIEAVRMMQEIGVDAWKMASMPPYPELLAAMAEDGKPVIISTGMNTMFEIGQMVQQISPQPTVLMQCTSRYPTTLADTGLNVIDELHERHEVPVGLSCHSRLIWPAVVAMARGAALVEVHLDLPKSQEPDACVSLIPSELGQVCEAREAIDAMREPVDKDYMADMVEDQRDKYGRTWAYTMGLPAGTVIERKHLAWKKPGWGIEDINLILGRKLKVAVEGNRLVLAKQLEPRT